jgi:hypothetical protein
VPERGEVIGHGEVPFILAEGRVVLAHFEIIFSKGWTIWDGDGEVARFTSFTLDGREFEVTGTDEHAYVPISERWAFQPMEPLRATAEGTRFTVTYHHYGMSHYGSLSGDVTLEIDPVEMIIFVMQDLEFEGG